MTDKARDHLKATVDGLGPNMWLVLDEVAIQRYFGYGEAAVEAVEQFAKENGLTILAAEGDGAIRFGRAYPKADGS